MVIELILTETKLQGAYLIEPERHEDERGFFARTYCEREFAEIGIQFQCVQCNISFNKRKGTLRGMHYQITPYEEPKIVRCTMGSIYDVIIDIRPESPTKHQWLACELTAENRTMLYIPPGFAHGFQTLEDNSEVFYMMGEFYHAEYARGIRWDDPLFGIEWLHIEDRVISERDANFDLYNPNFF